MLWDESADDLKLVGAAGLTVAGDIDVDGTTNLDIVDIDGAVDMASTLQVDGAATFTTEITANGGIALGDSDKATFGASDDLSIYHNAGDNSSRIIEGGAGNLYIGGDNTYLTNAAIGANYLKAVDGGAVTLYHNNAAKLATASGGVTVTGELAATSLDISGDIDVDGTSNLDVVDIDGAVDMASTLAVGGVTTFNSNVNFAGATSSYPRLSRSGTAIQVELADASDWGNLSTGGLTTYGASVFNENSADVDFRVESSGNANMLFVDGGADAVGIGTGTPADNLHLNESGATSSFIRFSNSNVSNGWSLGAQSGGRFQLTQNGVADRLIVDSSGKVGIGVTPEAWHANATALQIGDLGGLWTYDDNSNPEQMWVSENVYMGTEERYIQTDFASAHQQRNGVHTFKVAASGSADAAISWTNAMTIDNSGNLLVGKTSENNGTVGVQAMATGDINATVSNDTVSRLNRLSGDGEILRFQKDTSTVGSIGSNAAGGTPVLDISANSSSGIMRMLTSGTEHMRIDSSGNVTKPLQPAFSARPASEQLNFAVGSWVTVVLGTENFDVGSNFASNTFTAPVTGKYQLAATVVVKNVDTASDYYQLQLTTSNRSYYGIFDPGGFSADLDYFDLTVSVLADMDASDTAYLQILQNTGTVQSDIDTMSAFSGYLAC
jgi:hypothetical protein